MTPKILLADDHHMIRKAVRLVCEMQLGFTDVSEVSSCNQLMSELLKNNYSHLLLDIVFGDGSALEILPNIRKLYPLLRIMVFSMHPEEIYGPALRSFNVFHYCTKTTPEKQFIRQLSQFLNNEQIVKTVPAKFENESPFSKLSRRELEVMHYLLKGWNNSNVCKALNLKWNTVSTYKKRILEKTQTKNLFELKELAIIYKISGSLE